MYYSLAVWNQTFKMLDMLTVCNLLIITCNLFSCCRSRRCCKWCKSRRYKGPICEASCVLDSVFYYCHSIFSSANWRNWVCASHLSLWLFMFDLHAKLWDRLGSNIFMPQFRSRIRDLAETKYGRVPSGDSKPNSWTLLDFGMYDSFTMCGTFLLWISLEQTYPRSYAFAIANMGCVTFHSI